MRRFMIEIPHEPTAEACGKVVDTFHETGSHWLTHADFGCPGGVHAAWLVIEADDADEARLSAPPYYRDEAKIVEVKHYTRFTREEIYADHDV